MLEPNDRRHLLDSLRPPDGYNLDCAIGTTFSLDLHALLTVPLAFALFGSEDEASRPATDPMALLVALRNYSDRIHIFCQAGQIAIPSADQLLFSYLEDSVFPVKAPSPAGVFHPKLWLLRFSAPDSSILYRLLCLSRNLTYDNSWDTLLAIEGKFFDRRKQAFTLNRPLADFVRALPDLALQPLPTNVVSNITLIQEELNRVDFISPSGLKIVRFWPLGIKGVRKGPFTGRRDRMLIISPFISKNRLAQLASDDADNVLISKLDSLSEFDRKTLKNFKAIYTLDPGTDLEYDDTPSELAESSSSLSGLHAKLYIADAGWKARIWTGSANATDAAFDRNVEFLIELIGTKKSYGIDAFLSKAKGQINFADLLQEYKPDKSVPAADLEQKRLEHLADNVVHDLALADLSAQILPASDPTRFRVQVNLPHHSKFTIPAGISLQCWPITLKESAAVKVKKQVSPLAEFAPVSVEALTSFYAFALIASRDGRQASRRFVLTLSVTGMPVDRRERVLRTLFQNKDQVLRLLQFMLSEDTMSIISSLSGGYDSNSAGELGRSYGTHTAIMESLVKALARDPKKLDPIARLVDDLRSSDGQLLLPDGFMQIWEPIWAARLRLGQ